MEEKYIIYDVNGKQYKIPETRSSEFEKDAPHAKINYTVNGKNYSIGLDQKDDFLKDAAGIGWSYTSFDDESAEVDSMSSNNDSNHIADILRDPNLSWWERVKSTSRAMDNEEAPNFAETAAKSTGAAGVTTAKMAVDAMNVAAKMGRKTPVANNPLTMLAGTIEAFTGKSVLDEDNPLNDTSEKLGRTAERLSKEADPTGGEMGFGELLKRGHIGLAMQKALGSGIESAPIMLATKHPATATLYMLGAAASNYEDETRDNPDIPEWKRGVNAVGSAALEMAIEKIADIPWKYFGKAGGEITDDLASGIIERVREEGIQTIAQRIKRAIINTGKDSASEGFEEVLTSLGNDALGSALDAIDGNSDYGFKAQWEEFKEQNPDATEEDFAWAKGKEYFESFLGGALSSIYIAGFGNAVKETREAKARNQFDNAYLYGGSLDYNSMYDTNDDVNIALENVVSASQNDNGEETLTREFIAGLSAEDAFALSRSEDVKEELRTALGELAVAKATQDGLNGKLDERLQGDIDSFTNTVNEAAENGNVVSGVYNNDTVFIKGGVVNPDGTVTLPNGQHGPVIVIDGDKKFTVDSKEISNARSQSVDTYLAESEELFRGTEEQKREFASNTMGPRAKQRAIQQYESSKIIINSENGLIQVEVQKILPNGSVLIKGKKGDLGGKSEVIIPAAAFYDAIARNDDGSPVFVEALNGSQQQELQEAEQTVTPTEPVDYRESEQTIMINGKPTVVEVTNQDDTADRVTYTYVDENGQPRIGSATVSGFAESIQQAAQPTQETTETISTDELPPIPEEGVPAVPDMSSPVATESAETTNPSVEETAPIFPSSDVHDETPLQKPKGRKEDEEEGGEIVLESEEINWDALFEQDKDAYLAELQNQFGEETLDILNEEIETAQNEIDSLGKAKTKNQNERIANRKKKAALQERINVLNGMVAQLTPSNEVAEEAVVETPVEEAPIAEEPVVDTEPIVEAPVTEEQAATTIEQTPVSAEPVDETAVIEQTTEPVVAEETVSVAPVAPNPVANPIKEAKKIEAHLEAQLNRDLSVGQKQDLAKSLGKKVADMFATREEYDAYQEDATNFGTYNEYFDEGVDNSFVNRQSESDATPKTSVPLSTNKKLEGHEVSNGVKGETSSTIREEDLRRFEQSEGGINFSWEYFSENGPISKREGESDQQKSEREQRFESEISKFSLEDRINLFNFFNDYLPSSISGLMYNARQKVKDLQSKGKNALADFLRNFVIEELEYRESIARELVEKHGLAIGEKYEIGDIEQIFDAYNNKKEKYNEKIFDKVIKIAKDLGVTFSFETRESNENFTDARGWYSLYDNHIGIDASLLEKGREEVLCYTILHELIHSVVSRAISIYSGRAVNKNFQFIDKNVLPKDVISGIETLYDIYNVISKDSSFSGQYGLKNVDEMLSEISNREFRALLIAKNVWRKFIQGVCKILGISEKGFTKSDALSEIENALDKILFSAEFDKLGNVYSEYYGHLDEEHTLDEIKDNRHNLGNTETFDIESPDIRYRKGENNDNFVEQFKFKQNNEQGELEYSDEFRGLQEESARMSGQLVSEKDGVQQAAIRGLVGRIGGTLQRELDRATSGRGYKLRNVVNESKGTSFDIIENVDGRLFHDIFEIVRAYLPNGELVDLHDNYNDAICYITSDGLAGFAVDANGNLISVYSLYGASKKGFLGAIKNLITEAGATHLDGYNSQLQPLAEIYSKVFGWKVASMMDYNMDYDHDNIAKNHGMPQVAFMVNTDADIETKHFDKDQYDEAVDYQQEQVKNNQRTEAQNASIDYIAGDARVKAIEAAVNEEAAKLGVKVTYKTREQMPKGHKNDKGYYNTKTGEIVICSENATDVADAIKTILHEAVAHKGLRKLMGDKFNEFINRVYNSLDAETKARVDALATANYNGDKAVAMEEYMATLAESENFAENSVWDKVKSIFTDIINAILGRNDIKIGDNELRYILRASYNNMVNPRGMESVAGWAQDQLMREEYGVNETSETPELLSRTGVDPTEVAATSAREVYDRIVNDDWNELQRQFQDAYQPVRVAIEAMQAETGDIPIEDYENYLLAQNHSSSRSRVEIDKFRRKYHSPIVKKVNKIIDEIMKSRGWKKRDKKRRAEVYKEVRQYLIAKHGLERNAYYQNTKGKMRDFAGLTGLFGLPSTEYQIAEQMAQDVVDDFEALIGDTMRDELWDKINSATDKTLRHSYESGLISRQQYNDIKAMFDFYIPLRGFDETTAEDVYAYARFEGNRFNPAVQTAKGRTSVADDPIAIIMNMAESEITQGNKNRAKQALYNYLLNRATANNGQNSLMQLQDVWFTITYDAAGNKVYQIAAPNFAIGETYEQFEARMQAWEAAGLAAKSKKGQVDVGMRFQKKMHQNAHYVYLKINGVDKAIFINGDPKAADAINGTYKQKSLFGENKMRAINRLISSTFTNYSLEFTARNYFRDMLYSHINIDIRESDPAYRKKFRQNWRQNNLGTMISMLKAYRAGEYDSRALTADEAAFVEFMENGGQTGYTVINSVENHKRDLEKAIERMQKGIDNGGVKDSTIFKFTLGAVELLNEASELVTRFAAFKTSRDMGRSMLTSINDAKEITVNFNTKGAQDGVGFLGTVARYFGSSKFFFNASVQGVQNIKAMADANKLKFCGVVGGMVATGFTLPIITAAITELLGGDDEEEYWNIPEYDRQNNICIVLGNGKYAKIPLPIGFREVYAIGDMVAAMLMDKKFSRDAMQVGIDIANKISSVVLPVNPLESSANGLSIMHSIAYVAAPSSAQFIIQELSNTDWKGAPLQKEYTYNENDPQWMKAYASNPEWMKMLSKWCNEHIGDADMKGWDWSPEKLDNRLSNIFGGIYTLIKKSGRSISAIWNEENRNLSNVPLAGVIIGSGIDSGDRFVDNAYYEMKEYYDKRIGYIERRAKTFGLSLDNVFVDMSDAHQPKMQEIYSNKEFDFMKEWYLGNKELEKMKNNIKKEEKRAAKEGLAPEENTELAALMNEYETERREFVNDMLEFD